MTSTANKVQHLIASSVMTLTHGPDSSVEVKRFSPLAVTRKKAMSRGFGRYLSSTSRLSCSAEGLQWTDAMADRTH